MESGIVNKIGCWVLCRNTAECNWFTFDTEDNDCLLFKTCSALDDDHKFITGEVECDYTTQYCKIFLHNTLNFIGFCVRGRSQIMWPIFLDF